MVRRAGSASRSRFDATLTSRTAASNASAFAGVGARMPLTFRTYWSAASAISGSDAGPVGYRRMRMLLHIRAT